MVVLQKAKLLKQLYVHRALGYEYIKPTDATDDALEFSNALPSSLDELSVLVDSCHLCPLAKTRKNVVFGEGNVKAKLMFIGEAPGTSEDDLARPFMGLTGELLDKIITNVLELKREDVYIANIIKCRPPNNRVPSLEEVSSCRPYIMEQIKAVSPDIIVALGSTSYHHLTKDYNVKISQVRGEVFDFAGAKLIPTFHPNFLLRNPSAKKEVFHDMLRVKRMLS